MKEQIKELRISCDGLAQLTKELKPLKYTLNEKELEHYNNLYSSSNGILALTEEYNSKEIDKAVDSLYLAKAWLGKVLGELGAENPYKSGYKTVEDIEPTADKAFNISTGMVIIDKSNGEPDDKIWSEKSHIEKVDWLRLEIEKIYKDWKDIAHSNLNGLQMCTVISFEQHIQEARFQLGFELQRIKENNNN